MRDVPDVQELLREYTARYEASGEARADDLLARVDGTDRQELLALIDAYLERAPREAFDPAAFAASPARPLTDDLARSLGGVAGTWPVLLPRLRTAARLRRSELVARLADALGFPDRQADVAHWYHGMERGTLEPQGVSDRVLDALAAVVGSTREQLRDAGRNLGGPATGADVVFARRADVDPAFAAQPDAAAAPAAKTPRRPRKRDELAELFTGGQDAGAPPD